LAKGFLADFSLFPRHYPRAGACYGGGKEVDWQRLVLENPDPLFAWEGWVFLSRLSQEGVVQRMSHLPVHDVAPHVQTVLGSSPISELRGLRIEQKEGSLLIFGTVSSFYHKQLAQEAVRAIFQECQQRDLEVVNRICVRGESQESSSHPEVR
jgi:hypothetical protein